MALACQEAAEKNSRLARNDKAGEKRGLTKNQQGDDRVGQHRRHRSDRVHHVLHHHVNIRMSTCTAPDRSSTYHMAGEPGGCSVAVIESTSKWAMLSVASSLQAHPESRVDRGHRHSGCFVAGLLRAAGGV